jgi:hypothetical protein
MVTGDTHRAAFAGRGGGRGARVHSGSGGPVECCEGCRRAGRGAGWVGASCGTVAVAELAPPAHGSLAQISEPQAGARVSVLLVYGWTDGACVSVTWSAIEFVSFAS